MHSLWTVPCGRCFMCLQPNKVYAFALSGPAREQFCGMAEEYVKYHLGRGFESLQFYQSLQMPIK